MKLLLLIICPVVLTSCWTIYQKNLRKIEAEGFNPRVDTVDIRPYKYMIKNPRYTPQYEVCETDNRLDLRLSIKGYEDTEYLPFEILQNTLSIAISDSSYEIVGGKLKLDFSPVGFEAKLCPKCLLPGNSVAFPFSAKQRRFLKETNPKDHYVHFFFCVTVRKDGLIYTLPSRKYFFR